MRMRPGIKMMCIHQTMLRFDERGRVIKAQAQTPNGMVTTTTKYNDSFGFEVTIERENSWGGRQK